MKKEQLKQVYGVPSESFHNRVVQTLDSLEATPVARSNSSKRRKIIAICAVAAVLGTFTVTAAATNLFGLLATRTGTYGLNIKVVNDESSEDNHQSVNMIFISLSDRMSLTGLSE